MPLVLIAVIGWAWLTFDVASHLVAGDVVRPAFVAITFVAWMAGWRLQLAQKRALRAREVSR